MNLALISYPELLPVDNTKIESVRQQHDNLYNVIRPHFTLIFPLSGVSEHVFINEVLSAIENVKEINFIARYATINKDALLPVYHTFLVPDEGNSGIIKLHDLFYSSSVFNKFHRLDIDYIPHIVLATSEDVNIVKRVADQWNSLSIEIKGKISMITAVKVESETITILKEIQLAKSAYDRACN